MKRGPLKRGKPLARTGRIKPRSDKRKREDKELNHMDEFRRRWHGTECWVCGKPLESHAGGPLGKRGTIDHLAGRSHKMRHHKTNLGWVAWSCHQDVIPTMDMKSKVEMKLRYDPESFDENVFAVIRKAKNGQIDF